MKKRARLADVMKHDIDERNREWQATYKKRKETHSEGQKSKRKETVEKVKSQKIKNNGLEKNNKKRNYSDVRKSVKEWPIELTGTALKSLRTRKKILGSKK